MREARDVVAREVHRLSPNTVEEEGWPEGGCESCYRDADAILTALSSAGLAVVPVDTALLTEADLIKVRDLADELHVAFKETDKERFTAGELAAVKISALMFSRVLQAGVRAGERARAAPLPPLASGGG